MTDLPLSAYVPVAFVLVITPGAATAVVVRNALAGGTRSGAATAAGIALANGVHATAAGLGLALLLRRSPAAFTTMRVMGGVYLAWLALGSLRRAWSGSLSLVDRVGTSVTPARQSPFGQGFLVNLLNPAVVTFYLAVVPGFLPADAGAGAFATLAAIHIGMAFTCHLLWTLIFDRLRGFVARPRPMRALDALAGTLLLALAVRTLWQIRGQ